MYQRDTRKTYSPISSTPSVLSKVGFSKGAGRFGGAAADMSTASQSDKERREEINIKGEGFPITDGRYLRVFHLQRSPPYLNTSVREGQASTGKQPS